jgi:hypothetical protein
MNALCESFTRKATLILDENQRYEALHGQIRRHGRARRSAGRIPILGRRLAGPDAYFQPHVHPYDMPVIPHGSSVYNYHFVMTNTNSPYAEYLSVGKGTDIQPIFSVLEGEPLPVNGKVSLDSKKPGFGVELKRELLVPFKS